MWDTVAEASGAETILRQRPATVARLAAAAAVIAAAVAGLVWLPILLYPLPSHSELSRVRDPAKRLELRMSARKLQSDARAIALQGIAGLVVVAGAIAAWRQLNIGRRQLFVAQEAQITERFTRAVDQLGSSSVDVRTGGIYALERIGRDSASDRASVTEILTAFVKVHSPWPPEPLRSDRGSVTAFFSTFLRVPSRSLKAPRHKQRGSERVIPQPATSLQPLRSRAPDVHAAMTVLGRRPREDGPTGARRGHTLGLGGVDLRFADMRGFDLEGAWLAESNLARAELENANLRGASLWRTDLRAALLIEADLRDADLREANLAEAWLHRAQLARVVIEDTNLTGAITEGARYDDSTN